MKKIEKIISANIVLFLFIFTCLFPNISYAINDKYLDDNNLWYDVESENSINENDMVIQVKCVTDTDNACFYLNVYYYNSNDEIVLNDENISLNFNINNDNSKYNFVINKNEKLDSFINNNFNIISDFSRINNDFNNGEFVVGIEFKNKEDKKLLNYINCDFSVNNFAKFNLLNKYEFDMYAPLETTTKKVTTTKRTNEAISTKIQNDSLSRNSKDVSTTAKLSTTKAKKSTKSQIKSENIGGISSSSGRNSNKEKTTKFVASNTYIASTRENTLKSKSYKENSRGNNKYLKSTAFENTKKSYNSRVYTTKYDPKSKYKSSNSSAHKSTKFDPEAAATTQNNINIQAEPENGIEKTTQYQYDLVSRKLKISDKAKSLIIVASVMMVAGLGFVTVGTLSGKYKRVKNVESDELKDTDNNSDNKEDKNK